LTPTSSLRMGLMRRCDDVVLEPVAVALSGDTAFVEWTMAPERSKGVRSLFIPRTHSPLHSCQREKSLASRLLRFVGPPLHGACAGWFCCAGSTRRFVS